MLQDWLQTLAHSVVDKQSDSRRSLTQCSRHTLLSLRNLKYISPLLLSSLQVFTEGCHLLYCAPVHSCTTYTVCRVYEERNAVTHPKETTCLGAGMQWNKHSRSRNTHPHAQTASFSCTHSFLLEQHKSYQACCQGKERETNTENEKDGE